MAAFLPLGTSLSSASGALFAETRTGTDAPPDGSPSTSVAADFPYESRFVEVLGSRMHYVEQGVGDPIVLLHGNPSSSYLWRNVIPHLSGEGRAIAPDLIDMDRSDKPSIDYRFADHYRHAERFIEAEERTGELRYRTPTALQRDPGADWLHTLAIEMLQRRAWRRERTGPRTSRVLGLRESRKVRGRRCCSNHRTRRTRQAGRSTSVPSRRQA